VKNDRIGHPESDKKNPTLAPPKNLRLRNPAGKRVLGCLRNTSNEKTLSDSGHTSLHLPSSALKFLLLFAMHSNLAIPFCSCFAKPSISTVHVFTKVWNSLSAAFLTLKFSSTFLWSTTWFLTQPSNVWNLRGCYLHAATVQSWLVSFGPRRTQHRWPLQPYMPMWCC